MSDLCLDEFTDHGHCGVLDAAGDVDNDRTLRRYADMAAQQAEAGVHLVAPSGMMDGQVAAVRAALDRPATRGSASSPTRRSSRRSSTAPSATRSSPR
jgi:delta-aminolevulinic acid dehydratase/porphobilinogen synthase